jgi:hypothetical protein
MKGVLELLTRNSVKKFIGANFAKSRKQLENEASGQPATAVGTRPR